MMPTILTLTRGLRSLLLAGLGSFVASPHAAQQTAPVPLEEQLADALCDHQLVLLGELPSHGEARAFQTKARIVEELVNRCGFDALFFEAGIYDFLGFQNDLARGEATIEQLDRAIGGFWTTRGLSDWRRWLFDQAVAGKLTLGGLDDQPSATAEYARATLPNLVATALPEPEADTCRDAVNRNLFWRYSAEQPYNETEQLLLQQCTREAAKATAPQASSKEPQDAHPIERHHMLENIASYYHRQTGPAAKPDRDEVMARNLRWQVERLSPESKAIVWTSTVHAARQQGPLKTKPLGAWLADTWGDRLAAVGFTAFSGESSMAGQPSRKLDDAPTDALEARVTDAETSEAYLDRPALRALGSRPSRLFRKWTEADWSAFFDGVVVFREEKAPQF